MLHPLVYDWWCCTLAQIVFHRPDEEAMNRILEQTQFERSGIILRLAWKLGLSREEIHDLKWADFSFHTKFLHLPDRTVPMDNESCVILQGCAGLFYPESPWVVASVHHNKGGQMAPESISRSAKETLNKGGIVGISLADLRNDFVIRSLEKHDWPYVASITGMSVNTMFAKFAEYMPAKRTGKRGSTVKNPHIDEKALWKLMNEEGSSPVGLALQLCWQLGIGAQEAVDLTWDRIDFNTGLISMTEQVEPMSATLRLLLQQTKEERAPDDAPYVILSERTKAKMDIARLSKVVRTALIRAGMPDVTLRNLKEKGQLSATREKVLQRAAGVRGITRREAAEILQQSEAQTYNRLRALTEDGDLVMVGKKYYLAGTVVLEENQYDVICDYLKMAGGAYRNDIADLLRIDREKCKRLLRDMVAEGKLALQDQMYRLPEEFEEKTTQ